MCVCVCVFWISNTLHICWEMFWEVNILIGSFFELLDCCIHLYVFFPSLKNSFSQARQLLDRSSTDSLLLSSSFFCLDRSYRKLDPSSFLDFFLIEARQLLRSIELKFWSICLADRSSIASRSIEAFLLSTDSGLHLDRLHLSRFSARQIPQSIELRFL